jgi:hypothetical protein
MVFHSWARCPGLPIKTIRRPLRSHDIKDNMRLIMVASLTEPYVDADGPSRACLFGVYLQ